MPEYTKLQYTIQVQATKLNTYNIQYKFITYIITHTTYNDNRTSTTYNDNCTSTTYNDNYTTTTYNDNHTTSKGELLQIFNYHTNLVRDQDTWSCVSGQESSVHTNVLFTGTAKSPFSTPHISITTGRFLSNSHICDWILEN